MLLQQGLQPGKMLVATLAALLSKISVIINGYCRNFQIPVSGEEMQNIVQHTFIVDLFAHPLVAKQPVRNLSQMNATSCASESSCAFEVLALPCWSDRW